MTDLRGTELNVVRKLSRGNFPVNTSSACYHWSRQSCLGSAYAARYFLIIIGRSTFLPKNLNWGYHNKRGDFLKKVNKMGQKRSKGSVGAFIFKIYNYKNAHISYRHKFDFPTRPFIFLPNITVFNNQWFCADKTHLLKVCFYFLNFCVHKS